MHAASFKILAVDDEALLLWALERACEGRSLDIQTAVTTREALAEIERNHFDLFLLDFDLRDPSRLELLTAIDRRCPYVPIIIMTTADKDSREINTAIRAARKQGAWHLVEKPFSLDRMLSFIEVIFQDHDRVQLCLNDLSHNFDNEKRIKFRRPQVQAVDISFSSIIDGVQKKTYTSGITTDISDGGLGLLTHYPLHQSQVINLGGALQNRSGIVAWSCKIEDRTCRVGVQLC